MVWDIVGSYGGTTEENYNFFTIQQLIDLGYKYPDKVFKFIGSDYSPDQLISWRGSYYLASVSYTSEDRTGKQIAKDLSSGLEREHYGYKGGVYKYYPTDEFYISQYGSCEDNKVVGYEVETDYVVLLTKKDEY